MKKVFLEVKEKLIIENKKSIVEETVWKEDKKNGNILWGS